MGISSSFYISLSGLQIAQAAMDIVSNNITNVNTEGYSRQELNLVTPNPYPSRVGPMGVGVDATNITRSFDKYVQANLVDKTTDLSKYEAQKVSMDAIESIFNESMGNGLNEALSDFWNAWQEAANNPEGNAERMNILEKTDTLTKTINLMRQDLDQIKLDINNRVEQGLVQVNTLAEEIAQLNVKITAQEAGSTFNANDLRDDRDRRIKELATYLDIQYYEDSANGQVTILTTNGTPLVANEMSWDLVATSDQLNDDVVVNWQNENGALTNISDTIRNGQIGGWLELRDDIMDDIYYQFEAFTEGLITEVNRQHSQGVGLANYTDTTSSFSISDEAMFKASFEGFDNDIDFSALFPGADGESIGIKFVKSTAAGDELRVSTDKVANYYNITVTLPVNGNGQITATAEDVVKLINGDRTEGLPIPAPFPPSGPPYKAGDLLQAQLARGEQGSGTMSVLSNPQETNGFYRLNFNLENTLEFGDLIEWKDYASTETNLDGNNNDLVFTVHPDWLKAHPNQNGEAIGIEYVSNQPSPANQAFSIDIVGSLIRVTPATDASGNITTTANEVMAQINSHPGARDMVQVQRALGDSGEGIITGMDPQYLDRSASFDLVVYDLDGEPTVTSIKVRPTDTKEDLINQINSIDINGFKPISADVERLTGEDYIRIQTESGYEFAFANDTSSALAALGLNTFFTGFSASTIAINENLVNDIRLMATGRVDENGEIQTGDNTNALDLADVKDKQFTIREQTTTISEAYNTLAAEVGATSYAITSDHDFNASLVDQLLAQRDMVSAVNLDEEMADLLRYQYMYQAAAKLISTVDEMLQSLLSSV